MVAGTTLKDRDFVKASRASRVEAGQMKGKQGGLASNIELSTRGQGGV